MNKLFNDIIIFIFDCSCVVKLIKLIELNNNNLIKIKQ